MDHADSWDPHNPFVTDADGHVVGLQCVPPHHACLLAEGWEGGRNLFPLIVEAPDLFTADLLVYTRGIGADRQTRTATLPDESPYVYLLSDS